MLLPLWFDTFSSQQYKPTPNDIDYNHQCNNCKEKGEVGGSGLSGLIHSNTLHAPI